MKMTKRDEIREFLAREVRQALGNSVISMSDRGAAEVIRLNREYLAREAALHIAEEYRFLELADIMEWKRTRIRR